MSEQEYKKLIDDIILDLETFCKSVERTSGSVVDKVCLMAEERMMRLKKIQNEYKIKLISK